MSNNDKNEWQGAYCKNCGCECHCVDSERQIPGVTTLQERELYFLRRGECYECSTGGEVCDKCEHE